MNNDIRAKSAHASETALSVVSDWTPWAVAAAPACAIGYALVRHELPWLLIGVVSVAVELAGVHAGHSLTEAREYNADASEDQRRAVWPLGAALGVYVVVGCALAVVLDVWPALNVWWPVLLPLLAVMVYWVTGERTVIRHARARMATQTDALPDAPAASVDTRSKRKRVMDALDESDGDINDATLAEQIMLSEATVRGYRAQWRKERQPLAVSTNGNGRTH